MIFSEKKWNKSEEIKQYVKTSAALSFTVMVTPLRNAFDTFISPLLGEEMTNKLVEFYNSDESKDCEKQVLAIAQKANANLAFYNDFDEINVRITDSGTQRQENVDSGFKTLYQSQEHNLRRSFRNKGFNALDQMLEFLEKNIDSFDSFKKSNAYTFRRDNIVPSASFADKFYFIASSRIVFLRMLPHLEFVENTLVRQTLGEALYKHFKEEMFSEEYSGEDKIYFDTLRNDAARVMVLGAVRRLIIDGGSLTDRGLYFSSQETTSNSGYKIKKADGLSLEMQLNQLKTDLDQAVATLVGTAKSCFSSYAARNPREAFDRDNTGKRTFFA